ncbi:unnamed protein product, partial [marine sediment metagenome]
WERAWDTAAVMVEVMPWLVNSAAISGGEAARECEERVAMT